MRDGITHAAQAIADAVTTGDRRRRAVAALNATVTALPFAAAAAAASVLTIRLLGGPPAALWVTVIVAVLAMAVVAARAAWPHRADDPVAACLDRDAGLDGALRSAHWFAERLPSDDWTAYHLATAADRVREIDWHAVYAPAPVRRPLGTAAVALAVAALVTIWPGSRPRLDAAAPSSTPAPLAAADIAEKLEDMVRALARGELTVEDAQRVLEDLLKDPNLSQDARKQISSMTGNADQMSQAPNENGEAGSESQQASGEGQPQGTPQNSEDLQWALDETASKMASEEANRGPAPQSDGDESKSPSESSESDDIKQPTPLTARESAEDRERQTGGGAGLSLDAESQEQSAAGQRGEGLSSSGAGDTDGSRALAEAERMAQALAREIVRAIDSPEGKNIQIEDPRRTESRRSSIGFSGIAGLSAYDRSKADTTAIVPEARRPLLERYFVREE